MQAEIGNMIEKTDTLLLQQLYEEDVVGREQTGADGRTPVDLDMDAIDDLAHRLSVLPEDEKNAICGIYYFCLAPDACTLFYGTLHPEGIARYYRDAMSSVIGLEDTKKISDRSMYAACEKMLQEEMENIAPAHTTSHKKQKTQYIIRYSIAAAAAIVAFLIFGTSASAKLRSWFISWLITPHKEYSEVVPVSDRGDLTVEEAALYCPTYIPAEYTYDGEGQTSENKYYSYVDADGYYLTVDINLPYHITNLNTENAIIEDAFFQGEHAFYILRKDGINFFICVIDGYPVHIYGRTSKEELLKIAEGIRRREE